MPNFSLKEENEIKTKDIAFGYRSSPFQENNYVILKAKLHFQTQGNIEKLIETTKNNLKIKKESQPYDLPSFGSVFKNPKDNYAAELIDQLGLKEIYEELRRVSKQCKELKIDKKEFFGGSMTISSLGGIGGNFFTPIINPPEVAILGVGKTFDKVKKVNGQFIERKMLPISLSYDHRVIDGAEGARFCVHLSKSLGKDFAFKLAV